MGSAARAFISAGGVVALLIAAAFLAVQNGAYASHDAGGTNIDILAFDVDASGNTATSVGTIDDCVSLAGPGSTTTVDVIVDQIPAGGISVFGFDTVYNPAVLRVTAAQTDLLLASGGGYVPFNFIDSIPDSDGAFRADVVDLGTNYETGEGVLMRLTFEAVGSGSSPLTFDDRLAYDGIPDIGDSTSTAYEINNLVSGTVRVGQPCSAQTDLQATAANVTSPASATSGAPFTVAAGGTVVNNGPVGPVVADVVVSLIGPTDCTAAGGMQRTIQDVSLDVGTPVTVPVQNFAVTCTNPSFHSFSSSLQLTLDDPVASETALANNVKASAQATTAILANSDLAITGVALSITQVAAQPSPGITLHVNADVIVHNNGPAGPAQILGGATLTVPSDCNVYTNNPAPFNSQAQVSVAAVQSLRWTIVCDTYGVHNFSVNAFVAPFDIHTADAPGNNTGSASISATLKVGACGDDPDPQGDIIQNLSPMLIGLIGQLTATGTPVPDDMQQPFDCQYDQTGYDLANTPIDDCPVQLVTEAPCGLSFDMSINIPGGDDPVYGGLRLNPIGVTFVPPAFDWATDLEVPNGTPSGSASFGIRTDAGLVATGLECQISVAFDTVAGVEGGIAGNVPESNNIADLTNPNVWPNDLNAERALVEGTFTPLPIGPSGVTLHSRTIFNLVSGSLTIPMNVLTWKVTNPVFQAATGALWIVVPFPGDAVNPDAPGTIGGDPDADDPESFPFTYCTPHNVSLNFSGKAGNTVFLACKQPGSHMGWNLIDPDALNFTGDDGPRSDLTTCSLDLDNDGLSADAETYWGTNPNSTDTDADGRPDVSDNCKTISNAGQADYDGDGIGDVCDADVDGDGTPNTSDVCPNTVVLAQADSSGCSDAQVDMDGDGYCNPGAQSHGPSNCVFYDNCNTVANSDQSNMDDDIFGDACDPCPTYANYWIIPPNDSDCDGFDDASEAFVGTLGSSPCSSNTIVNDEAPDAWPPDMNDNRLVNILDVGTYSPVFGKIAPDPEYGVRFDINGDGKITILDVSRMYSQTFSRRCT